MGFSSVFFSRQPFLGFVRCAPGGRPVTYPRRDIVDAICYLKRNGGVWRALPVDFPPWSMVNYHFKT
ncbi:transposase [Phytohabitans rumicis]|uniref:transposase n=1 Tax=Phytohabitans rumicis TaxID=1076125 RepID=UPI002483B315|nr:transposase [Phytohabitans rumicis]